MSVSKRSRSATIPELKVVLDSNAIYSQSAHYLLKHEVFDLMQTSVQYPDLRVTWYLPEPVRHERQYQMIKRALELLQSVQKLERLLGHNLNITEEILEQRVQGAIDKQIKELNISLIQVDFASVDWNNLMLDAAYRRPPFSPGETEKGFRDALIAEAFVSVVSTSPKTPKVCRIALVTGDELLAKAVKNRTSNAKNTRILPTVEELKGLINTLVSAVGEDFVESIRAKAHTYFFKPGETSTLFYKERIWVKIYDKFRKELSSVPPGADEREKITTLIGAPRFVKKEGQRVFWANRITEQAKAYKYDATGSLRIGLLNPEEPSGFLSWKQPQWSSKLQPIPGYSIAKTEPGLPGLTFGGTSLYNAPRPKSLFKTGEIMFEVTWSVAVSTTQRKLSKPRIESIEHIETKWE